MAPTTRSRAPRTEEPLPHHHDKQEQQQQAPIEQSDDDDAPPEEVTLASSRQQAKQELQAQQQAAKSAAKARRRSAAAADSADPTRDQEQGSSRKRAHQDAADDGQEHVQDEQPNAADLLPEDVLNALEVLDDHRTDVEQQGYAKHVANAHERDDDATAGRKRQKKSHVVKRGPVMVATMKAVQKQATGTASSFLKDHLHGSRLKRSAAMLQPVANRRLAGGIVGPAAKFV